MLQKNSDDMQLFLRAVTNKSISERDLLMQYSVGAFYQELNLFIKENRTKK